MSEIFPLTNSFAKDIRTGFYSDDYCADGCRLGLLPMTDGWHDQLLVTYWRNLDSSRRAFYSQDVVTPDTHLVFMANRAPHDLVFMLTDNQNHGKKVGMLSITVDVKDHTAEMGRMLIAPEYRGQGLARHADYIQFHYAFEFLNLKSVWGEIFAQNDARMVSAVKGGWEKVVYGDQTHQHEGFPEVALVTLSHEYWDEVKGKLRAKLEENA